MRSLSLAVVSDPEGRSASISTSRRATSSALPSASPIRRARCRLPMSSSSTPAIVLLIRTDSIASVSASGRLRHSSIHHGACIENPCAIFGRHARSGRRAQQRPLFSSPECPRAVLQLTAVGAGGVAFNGMGTVARFEEGVAGELRREPHSRPALSGGDNRNKPQFARARSLASSGVRPANSRYRAYAFSCLFVCSAASARGSGDSRLPIPSMSASSSRIVLLQ